jgi:cell division protein FtsB
MFTALTYVGGSVTVLLLLTAIYIIEDSKGRRIILPRIRGWFDAVCRWFLLQASLFFSFFSKGFVRVLLHYGVHSILNRLLATLRKLEKKVEELVRRNRTVVKNIRKVHTKSHLDEIAEHKEETALSPGQKKKLRSHE